MGHFGRKIVIILGLLHPLRNFGVKVVTKYINDAQRFDLLQASSRVFCSVVTANKTRRWPPKISCDVTIFMTVMTPPSYLNIKTRTVENCQPSHCQDAISEKSAGRICRFLFIFL